MRAADTLIDIGPAAGRGGGRIVAQGTPADVIADPRSITGRYLSGQPGFRFRPPGAATKTHSLVAGRGHETTSGRRSPDPAGGLRGGDGGSGSGKSSLINETPGRRLPGGAGRAAKPGPSHPARGEPSRQAGRGRPVAHRSHARSNPATYTGVFDEIRKVFAETREARQRGYRTGPFSASTSRGAVARECQGQGVQRIEMNFLPDLTVPCPVCDGARFNRQTLEVHYRGRSIAAVLDMRSPKPLEFFENFPPIAGGCAALATGRPGLSDAGPIVDHALRRRSPTDQAGHRAGPRRHRQDALHPRRADDRPALRRHPQLLAVLNRLVDRGNTVLVIEHNLDVIKTADWIIDLGPEGAPAAG